MRALREGVNADYIAGKMEESGKKKDFLRETQDERVLRKLIDQMDKDRYWI